MNAVRSLPLGLSLTCLVLAQLTPPVTAQLLFREDFESGTTCYWNLDYPATFGLPTDPTWASALQAESECVDFELSGLKDETGLLLGYDQLLARWSWGDEVQTRLDALGRPVEMVVEPSGVVFELSWLSPTAASVTAVNGDGTVQASLLFDLAAPDPLLGASARRLVGPGRETGAAARGPLEAVRSGPAPTPAPPAAGSSLEPPSALVGGGGSGAVIVTRCGQGLPDSDFFVQVSTNSAIDGESYNLPCNYSSPGTCFYEVPSLETPSALVEDICESVAGAAGNLCDWIVNPAVESGLHHRLCLAMAVAVDTALGGPTGEGTVILGACESAFAASEAYCLTLGASPGGPSTAERICSEVEEIAIAFPDASITFTARASVEGHPGFLIASEDAPLGGPYPTFELEVPDDPTVESFSTSPLDPAPGQGYTATASLACLPEGTIVGVSITGSDGYSDSIECTLSGSGSCSLGVPGGEEGVVDTLRTFLGGELVRTTAVVF